MSSSYKSYISLFLWVISLIIIGMIIGNLTKGDLDSWYASLNKSSLTPAGYVFGMVWSILYAIIGLTGWYIWQIKSSQIRSIKRLYIAQLFLNWSWTPLFFTFHLIGAAFISICLIALLVTLIIIKTYKTVRIVSLLFMPYLVWLLFAAYLNFYIWQYNG